MNQLEKIMKCFPISLQNQFNSLDSFTRAKIEEIRLYKGLGVEIFTGTKIISLNGNLAGNDLMNILNNLMKFSYYAYEDDISKGFITIDGGHRVGICGKAVLEKGRVKIIRDISSLNIRYSKEIIGCSDEIMNLLINPNNTINNTLIVSPPGCGKTTLLRDIARNISLRGYKVGICDERSEIAGMYNGVSPYSFGKRVDVLDGCPKALGMIMLIRAMSPQVIISDEIGKKEDIDAIKSCINSGVKLITSVHGNNVSDLKRTEIYEAIEKKLFNVIIFLTDIPKVGSIGEVLHD